MQLNQNLQNDPNHPVHHLLAVHRLKRKNPEDVNDLLVVLQEVLTLNLVVILLGLAVTHDLVVNLHLQNQNLKANPENQTKMRNQNL